MNGPVVYIAAQFPKLSETFVYREVLGLRAVGVPVQTVSVRPSTDAMGDPALEALKQEAVSVYDEFWRRDALLEGLAHPVAATRLLWYAAGLALRADDLKSLAARAKTVVQGFAALALARRLRRLRPVLLHAHMAHVPATLAMFTARQLGVPFSFTGHAADIFRDRALLVTKLQTAAFVNCISHWHRHFYQDLCPRPGAAYPVVRCGVDAETVPPRPAFNGPPRLLAAGRLVKKKGFDVLLDALASPDLRDVPWTLNLIGDGPEEAALHRQWEYHPARNRITFAGSQPNAEVQQAMAEADIFILPCRVDPDGDRDGIPVVLMEAMAAGAVVVSGDIPSIRELIDDGRTGLFVAPGDAERLADALVRLCRDADWRAQMTRDAHAVVTGEFSLSVNIRRILDTLSQQNLIPAGAPPS